MGGGRVTIGKVMGVTSPGKVIGVANASIGKVMGVTNSAPPPSNVIEDYEGTPLVSDYTWTKNLLNFLGIPITSTVTVASSVLHVTEGTNSWKYTGTTSPANLAGGLITTTTTDISSWVTLDIDIYVQSCAADDYILYAVSDGTGTYYESDGVPGATGAFTLNLDIASAAGAGVNTAAAYIIVVMAAGSAGAAFEYYTDNLRYTTEEQNNGILRGISEERFSEQCLSVDWHWRRAATL